MFDIGWGEFVVIGAVALVVIGPKELPSVLRTVGGAVSKLKRMAGEFQQQFNEAIRESEFEEARKAFDGANNTINSGSTFNPIQTIRDEIKNAVEGNSTTTTTPTTNPPATPALPAAEVQATAPGPILDIPAPPPVPDLTPEQIQAAFAGDPAATSASPAPDAAPVEEAPAPRKRRSKKAEAATEAEPEPAALAAPAAPAEPAAVEAAAEAEPEKPKRRARKAKTTEEGGDAG